MTPTEKRCIFKQVLEVELHPNPHHRLPCVLCVSHQTSHTHTHTHVCTSDTKAQSNSTNLVLFVAYSGTVIVPLPLHRHFKQKYKNSTQTHRYVHRHEAQRQHTRYSHNVSKVEEETQSCLSKRGRCPSIGPSNVVWKVALSCAVITHTRQLPDTPLLNATPSSLDH